MAHNLTTNNGKTSMFYYGDVPWHGLGKRLAQPGTSKEAIQAAGLDWQVQKRPLYLKLKKKFQVKEAFAIVRKDKLEANESQILGVVGKNYTPIQNEEAFQFFDDIVGQKSAIFHTAGSLNNDRVVWILAKLPGFIRVVNDDITYKFLLLTNSHDGSSSVQVKFTPIRVVCQNTLSIALKQGENFKIKHTKDVKERLSQAIVMMGMINDRYTGIEQSFKKMSKINVTKPRLNEYLKAVFPDTSDELQLKGILKQRDLAAELFETGIGSDMKGVKGTLWGAYNTVTELVDHKNSRLSPEKKTASIWLGNGAAVKSRAFDIANDKMKLWLN